MNCNKLIKKAVFQSTSLAVILLISTKLVLACASVVCDNGVETNICSIDANKHLAQTFFVLSLILFLVNLILYFVMKRKSVFIIILSFSSAFLPIILRWLRGFGSCDFFSTTIAKWLFYSLILIFTFQIILWIYQNNKVKLKLK